MSPAAAKSDPVVQLCAFVVGGEEYVIDAMRIHSIIAPQRVTAVPRAPDFIEGVIHVRDGIVPIIDLRKRLGAPVAPPSKKTKVIICRIGGRQVGLIVDAVSEVLRLPRSQIQRAPSLLSRGPKFFLGVCGPSYHLKLLLNVKALLESSEAVPGRDLRELARAGEESA